MPKSNVFKDTSEILSTSFPVLLKGFKEVVDVIPYPVGSVVKGIVQGAIFIMGETEKYKDNKEDIYLLSARMAQILTVIINEYQWLQSRPDNSKIEEIGGVIKEISEWIRDATSTRRRDQIINFFKTDAIVKDVVRLNNKLTDVISRFGLQSQVAAQKSISALQGNIDTTKEMINETNCRLARIEVMQSIERRFPPANRIETLFPTDSRCLSGTRRDILRRIETWIDNPQSASNTQNSAIFWLTGVAGCGKSSISRSIVDLARKKGLVCSYFFFSRDFKDRQGLDKLMPTVAYDFITSGNSAMVQEVEDAISRNISGASSFSEQVDAFLMAPLYAVNYQVPVVLVWDALDECMDSCSRQNLLQLLQKIPTLPSSVRIILTSRQERDLEHLRKKLGKTIWHHNLTFDAENSSDSTFKDITTYMTYRCSHIMMHDWLQHEDIPKLVSLADGLFMAADFICTFIDHPMKGQSRFVSLLRDTVYDQGGSTTNRLYNWYYTGLKNIFEKEGPNEMHVVKKLMSFILVAQYPLSRSAIASLLKMDEQDVHHVLDSLSPFLVSANKNTGVHYVHKSMADFLVSETAREFHIEEVSASADVALPCLQILHNQISEAFQSSISLVSKYEPTSQIGLKPKRSVYKLPLALSYACYFWGFHLKDVTISEKIKDSLQTFFFNHLIQWLHVMGHFDLLVTALSSLEWIQSWKFLSKFPDILELARDSIQFIQRFSYPLRTYETMKTGWLYLTPKESSLYQRYHRETSTSYHILRGIPNRWQHLQITIEAHKDRVKSVAFSPDGKYVVSGSSDNTIWIWNALTGQSIRSLLKAHTDPINSITVSPDGKYIISGSYDGTIRIWNAYTYEPLGLLLKKHNHGVTSISFSPDGNYIAFGSSGSTVRIWNFLTDEPVGLPLKGHLNQVNSVAFSPDGKYIVSGSRDNTIRLWDAIKFQAVQSPLMEHADIVHSVAFSPSGTQIASGSKDKTVRIWNAITRQSICPPLKGHTDWVNCVTFSPDGKYIVSGSEDKTIQIWNASTGQPIGLPLQGHTGAVNSICFSPNGKHIVSGSNDKTVRIWEFFINSSTESLLEYHTDRVSSVSFSSNGEKIVSGSYDCTVRIWNALTGEPTRSPLKGHQGRVNSVAFSPDGEYLVSGSGDKTIRVWDTLTGQLVRSSLKGHKDQVNSVIFSPDGKQVISGSYDNTVMFWDIFTGQSIGTLLKGQSGWINYISFTPDSKYIMSESPGDTAIVWNSFTRQQVRPYDNDYKQIMNIFFNHIPFKLLDDGWLMTHDHHQILWLPTVNQVTCSAWSAATRCLVIGYESGSLSIVKFDENNSYGV